MFHLSVKPISRSAGRSATAAAAYRAGAEIADLRTGELHDYTRKRDVVQEGSGILVPAGAPAWAEDRAALWNAAEAAEKRKDARVARDYEVAIPKELTQAQGISLVRDFSQGLVDRYGVAVDYNIHRDDLRKWDGTEKGWQGYHAHVLTSTRQLGREGFGDKAEIELSDTKRKSLGLGDGASEIERVRQLWEVTANRHLEQANSAQRIDRRSLKDQGIDRDPTVHLGPHVTGLERDGIPSRLGDINRQVVSEHRVRVEDRRQVAEMAIEVGQLYGEIVERGRGRGRSGESPERGQGASAYRPTGVLVPEEREAVRRALKELVRKRDQKVRQALERAEKRLKRRDKAYQAIVKGEPVAAREFDRQAGLAWQAAKEVAAKLVEQARRLGQRLLEASGIRQVVEWSREALGRPARQGEARIEIPRPQKARELEPQATLRVPALGLGSRPLTAASSQAQPLPPKDLKTQAAEGVAAFRVRREKERLHPPEKSLGEQMAERLKLQIEAEQRAAERKRVAEQERQLGKGLGKGRGKDGHGLGD